MSDTLFDPGPRQFTATPFGISFVVEGAVVPQSKPKNSRVVYVGLGEPRTWREKVSKIAHELMDGQPLFTGPLMLYVKFEIARPDSHYQAGRMTSRARQPSGKPSIYSLASPLLDALTGIVWKDQGQIVDQRFLKWYGSKHITEVKVGISL